MSSTLYSQINLNVLTWNIQSIFTEYVYGHKMLKTMLWDVYNNFVNHVYNKPGLRILKLGF
jgi:hypothetical protein